MRAKQGFTLVELLVVIAIIGILAAMLFPAISGAMLKGKATKFGNAGRQLALALYSEDSDRVAIGVETVYPSGAGAIDLASEFWKSVYTNGVLADFSLEDIIGPGMTAAPTNTADVGVYKNSHMWWVVGGADSLNDGSPLMYSRNFCKDDAGTKPTKVSDIAALSSEAKPFGDKVGIVVNKDGSFQVILKKFLYKSGVPDPARFTKLVHRGIESKTLLADDKVSN